jgi:hypothetical protein
VCWFHTYNLPLKRLRPEYPDSRSASLYSETLFQKTKMKEEEKEEEKRRVQRGNERREKERKKSSKEGMDRRRETKILHLFKCHHTNTPTHWLLMQLYTIEWICLFLTINRITLLSIISF